MPLIGKGAIPNDKDQTIGPRPAALSGAGGPLLDAGKSLSHRRRTGVRHFSRHGSDHVLPQQNTYAGRHRLHLQKNPAICSDSAGLWAESVRDRQGRGRLTAHYRLNDFHLFDCLLCALQATEHARQHLYPDRRGLLHLRRLRHRRHSPSDPRRRRGDCPVDLRNLPV